MSKRSPTCTEEFLQLMKPKLRSSRAPTAWPNSKRASVLGLGNVLMGDDGFGPLAVELFRCKYECGPKVDIRDVGTPGLDLAPYFYGTDLVIIADAVNAEAAPGTLCIYGEAELMGSQVPLRLTAHDPSLAELVAHLRMAGETPSELIIVGVVPQSCEFGEGISPAMLTASSTAVDTISCLLLERGIDCSSRPDPVQPNLWWLSAGSSKFAGQNPDSQH